MPPISIEMYLMSKGIIIIADKMEKTLTSFEDVAMFDADKLKIKKNIIIFMESHIKPLYMETMKNEKMLEMPL